MDSNSYNDFLTKTKANLAFFKLPFYSVDTRDSFAYDPIVRTEVFVVNGREITKKKYYFDPQHHPSNFLLFKKKHPDYSIGVTTYTGLFSNEELLDLEKHANETEFDYFRGAYLPFTGQTSLNTKQVKRTKFFFGYRYMWSAAQLNEPHSGISAGVRNDVSPIPLWMKKKMEKPMVDAGIVEKVIFAPNQFIKN